MNDTTKYDFLFQRYARANKLDWVLLKAQVKAESNFDEKAESPVGALGLAQFMPATWKDFGEGDPFNPVQSIKAQAKYMRWLFDVMIKLNPHPLNEWTLAAYNWGVGNVKKLIEKTNGNFEDAFSSLPDETQKYVKRISEFYEEYNIMVLARIKEKQYATNKTNIPTKLKEVNTMTQLPDNYGVENFTTVVNFLGTGFDGVVEAEEDDNKVSPMEAMKIAVELVPKSLGFISAIPKVPQEIVFDAISDEDIKNISKALDDVKHLKGDTRDATKELLPHLLGIKDWYFKFYVTEKPKA